MSIQSDPVLSANPAVGNPNLVPAPATRSEPAILELIEAVNESELPFKAPPATWHVRATYSTGPDRFVSFTPYVYYERDEQDRLCPGVQVLKAYVDGRATAELDAALIAELERLVIEYDQAAASDIRIDDCDEIPPLAGPFTGEGCW